MKYLFAGLLMATLLTACGPKAGEISGANKAELKTACRVLQNASWDYWQIDVFRVGGRTMEVAADIHAMHPGPTKTKKYCEKTMQD